MTDQLEAAWAARVARLCGYDCINSQGKATFMAGYAAARADAEARIKALKEALRRYLIFEAEIDGKEQLEQEFGAIEFHGSSISTDVWLERVLRLPAHAALADPPEASND